MNAAKLTLSPEETKLMTDPGVILTKNSVMAKSPGGKSKGKKGGPPRRCRDAPLLLRRLLGLRLRRTGCRRIDCRGRTASAGSVAEGDRLGEVEVHLLPFLVANGFGTHLAAPRLPLRALP